MKFGGSCLQSREGLLRMTDLIRREPRPLVIVLSALKGVTDGLIALTEAAGRGEVPDLAAMRQRHADVLEVLRGAPRAQAERDLAALHGESYLAYKRQVPMLVPRLGARETPPVERVDVDVPMRVRLIGD